MRHKESYKGEREGERKGRWVLYSGIYFSFLKRYVVLYTFRIHATRHVCRRLVFMHPERNLVNENYV